MPESRCEHGVCLRWLRRLAREPDLDSRRDRRCGCRSAVVTRENPGTPEPPQLAKRDVLSRMGSNSLACLCARGIRRNSVSFGTVGLAGYPVLLCAISAFVVVLACHVPGPIPQCFPRIS